MSEPYEKIVAHYGRKDLYGRIVAALAAGGVDEAAITAEHLKPVDEFHIGGVAATQALLDPLGLKPGTRLLDLGSGVGGPARFAATRYGAEATGIDLTPEFVETARRLSRLAGVDAEFVEGSVLDLPFADAAFDVAMLLHVGMNLPDKARLFREVARVLVPGGSFAVYDVMLFGGHPQYPVPWAATPETSFLAPPESYLAAAEAAGMRLVSRRDRGEVASAFFAEMQKRMTESGPPAVGLPMLMGASAGAMVANMVTAVETGQIQPVEMVFRTG